MSDIVVLPYTDFFVRYLLGDENNIDLLLSFINAVNEDSDFPKIKSITIKNPFNLKTVATEKESIIDVKAVDAEGRQYDIEIQTTGNQLFRHRSLYYWAKLYASQLTSGVKFHVLKPTVCINLLNFSLEPLKSIHSCFRLCEKNHPDVILTDHLMMHFLELPRFSKKENFQTSFDKWMAYFKYEGQEEEIMKTIIGDDTIISKAHQQYVNFTQNDELLELYEARRKYQLQYNTDVTEARIEGEKRGKIEGKVESAKQMLNDGLSVDKISQYTGLSPEEIEKLR